MEVLRADLLSGRRIALAGARPGLEEGLREFGASVELFKALQEDDSAEAWVAAHGPLNAVVLDVSGGEGPRSSSLEVLERGWRSIRAVVGAGLIPAGDGGKVVLLAPAPEGGEFATMARAALENLARTLSVEWARFQITVTCIAPGPDTTDKELQTLVAFLLSSAGDYFSGCRFDLGLIRRS